MRSRWLFWGVMILLLSGCSCGGPEPTSFRLVHQLWDDKGASWIKWSDDLGSVGASEFPLTVVVGGMGPDSGFLGLEKSKRYTIEGASASPLEIVGLPVEGGVVVWGRSGKMLDHVVFVERPADSVLVRSESKEVFCKRVEWFGAQRCVSPGRKKGTHRLRMLRSVEDFDAMVEISGESGLRTEEVKFVIDLERDGLTHFINVKKWPLHYTFYREEIAKEAHLDQCDAVQKQEFDRGWYSFSEDNYFRVEGRRFLLGTLIRYPGTGLTSIEFAAGDAISGVQMARAYEILLRNVTSALGLRIRPVSEGQKKQLEELTENKPELMETDAPYKGANVQLLSPGVAYGELRFLNKLQAATESLGLRQIVLLKEVPNDINFVGGIISTQFQSSLSHINVLSRNRGTPHLVIRDAASNPLVKKLEGKLVKLTVSSTGYTLEEAGLEAAQVFWKSREALREPFTPELDLNVKGVVDLSTAKIGDSRSIGAKAANLSELARVDINEASHISACREFLPHGLVRTPAKSFAIPFSWYAEHIQRAGLVQKIERLHQEKKFLESATYRKEQLELLRAAIAKTPINAELESLLKKEITRRYGAIRVRFRSSTNVEDLPNFNGAGLYESKSVELDNSKKSIANALHIVWSSLWNERAWNERQFYKVDHLKAAMAILVHPAFPSEKANGVVVSTNIFKGDGSTYETYIATQHGEISIVNPEGDLTPDQFLIRWLTQPQLIFLSRSTLTPKKSVLTEKESLLVGCYIQAIHTHFRPLLSQPNALFAMEAEFKMDGDPRKLFIKQTRPYVFGEEPNTPSSCKNP